MPLYGMTIRTQKTVIDGKTYGTSILNNILDITLCVNLLRGVCTIHRKLRILRNFKRKTLTVSDMPMESVDLSSVSVSAAWHSRKHSP